MLIEMVEKRGCEQQYSLGFGVGSCRILASRGPSWLSNIKKGDYRTDACPTENGVERLDLATSNCRGSPSEELLTRLASFLDIP